MKWRNRVIALIWVFVSVGVVTTIGFTVGNPAETCPCPSEDIIIGFEINGVKNALKIPKGSFDTLDGPNVIRYSEYLKLKEKK